MKSVEIEKALFKKAKGQKAKRMYQREIYDEAIRRIDQRRHDARLTQELHTDEIHEKLPETVEIDRQLHQACLSVLQIAGDKSPESRQKRILGYEIHLFEYAYY